MDITQHSSYGCEDYRDATDGPENHKRKPRKGARSFNYYGPDPLWYFAPLDGPSESEYHIEHQTDKAVLFRDAGGLFWVPKKLLRTKKGKLVLGTVEGGVFYVHEDFCANYIGA